MKRILWIQADSFAGKDNVFADGNKCNDDSEYDKANKRLDFFESLVPDRKMIKFRKEDSPNFGIYYNAISGFFFKSIFNEPAYDGRKKTVVYWCAYKNAPQAIADIEKNSKPLGYSLRDCDKKIIEALVSKKKISFKRILITLFCILCLPIFIFLLIRFIYVRHY